MVSRAQAYSKFAGRIGEFTSQSVSWWPSPPAPPQDAPNVIIVLVDDLGYSDLGPYGSEIPTPNIDEMANEGWLYTNYRTAPLCSPARASLMTGLNPHRAGFGFVAHADPGYPGYTCEIPANAPTLAESLKRGGYATFMVGKWHLTPESQLHDGAERTNWPLQRGFDRYFGSMDGFTSQHHPHRLVRDNSVIEREGFDKGYFLTDELTEEAIRMIDELRVNDAEKPFFLYFSHTSVHGPIQAKAADIARFRRRYESGWNRIRSERFESQKRLGIVSPDADLQQDDDVSDWDQLDPSDQELFGRHMEAYAAAVSEVDESLGKLRSYLSSRGELDNTLIVLTSDNGGSAEGGLSGTRSYFAQFAITTSLPDGWVRDVPISPEEIGGPRTFNQYPRGWAQVSNTPFREFKMSTYEGGVHAPLIVSWPNAPVEVRGLRDQFVFVSDLAPTILDLVGVPPLEERGGIPAEATDGGSVRKTFEDAAAPGRTLQYFECVGRRALIEWPWKLVSLTPPVPSEGADGGHWELYDLEKDPTESRDLAKEYPKHTTRLKRRWLEEAWRNAVFPLDDDGTMRSVRPATERMLSEPVVVPPFRPPLERYRSAQLTVLRSFTVEIDVEIAEGAHGALVAHGDQGGGYLFAVDQGAPLIAYNAYGEMHRSRGAVLQRGVHRLLLRFDELPELRWRVCVTSGNDVVVQLDSVPMLLGMAPFTGISVGYDYGGPVDWDLYEQYDTNRFGGGTIHQVRYVPGPASAVDSSVLMEVDRAVQQLID